MPKRSSNPNSVYTALIQKACRCEPSEAARVEEQMRIVHGTLDALTLPQFTAAAKRAQKVVQATDKIPGQTALEKLENLRKSLAQT